jgi:hypothetical protein
MTCPSCDKEVRMVIICDGDTFCLWHCSECGNDVREHKESS